MWGSRTRNRKRKFDNNTHTFDTVKQNIRNKSKHLRDNRENLLKSITDKINNVKKQRLTFSGVANIRDYKKLTAELVELEDELKDTQNNRHIAEFVEKVQPLLNRRDNCSIQVQQQKHTIFLDLFNPEKNSPCFIDRDICHRCGTEYVLLTSESMMMCTNPTCRSSERLVYCNSDFIQNHEPKPLEEQDRAPLYRKYLMKDHEDVPDIPDEVISIVYKHLSKVHIALPSKVKPNPNCTNLSTRRVSSMGHVCSTYCQENEW